VQTVSIVIPAYNEEAFIGTLLEKINSVPTETVGFKKEIIVVDDGSKDRTSEVVSKFKDVKLIRQENAGKGRAVQRGVSEATGDYVLVQDADLEYDPADYIPMLGALDGSKPKAVYGSRVRGTIRERGWTLPFPGRQEGQGIGPWGMNMVLMMLTRALYGRWITDMLTGYKVYPTKILKEFEVKTHGFETDHELTSKLVKRDVDIVEVPVSYIPRSAEEGKKIRPIDGAIAVWTLLKFRFTN
jgi:glycosyltransferase involved in cell wall biosynthesis